MLFTTKIYDLIQLSITNCYLIKGHKGFLLIDCGGRGDKKVFTKKLARLGLKASQIKYLVLTHHHNDHCGLLPFLMEENPDLCVIMSEQCSQYLKVGRHYHHPNERYANKFLQIIMKLYFGIQKNPDIFEPFFIRSQDIIIWEDTDDVLSMLGFSGHIMLTPGHTEDSLSVIMGDTAFVGDATRNFLSFTGAPYLPVIYYSESSCQESRREVLKQGIRYVCPAHGKPFVVEKWS